MRRLLSHKKVMGKGQRKRRYRFDTLSETLSRSLFGINLRDGAQEGHNDLPRDR
jgi:hypothetical protein